MGTIEMGRMDGTAIQSWIDFHSSGGNIDYDTRIRSTGGNAGVAGLGTLELIGVIIDDGRAPTNANQLVHKSWVDTQINNAVSSSTGAAAALYVHKAGDYMTGLLNMNGNRVANVPYPSAAADAIPLNYAQAVFYAPAGWGAAHSIHYSSGGPGGGAEGDIWIRF
jgi:hypothetical protein